MMGRADSKISKEYKNRQAELMKSCENVLKNIADKNTKKIIENNYEMEKREK